MVRNFHKLALNLKAIEDKETNKIDNLLSNLAVILSINDTANVIQTNVLAALFTLNVDFPRR